MKAKVLRLLKIIRSYLPSQLPQNEAAMSAYIEDCLDVAGFPQNSSFKIAIATMVLHLDSKKLKASKQGFILQLRRSVANQSAYNLMTELKEQEQKAALEAKQSATSQVEQEAKG